jgi:hypothetical protein
MLQIIKNISNNLYSEYVNSFIKMFNVIIIDKLFKVDSIFDLAKLQFLKCEDHFNLQFSTFVDFKNLNKISKHKLKH